jgi:phage gp36-like protein
MPFDSGTVSFRVCMLPQDMPEDALARFAAKAAGPLEQVKDEPQVGWVSGRHLLESRIDDETAFMGGYLHLVLRTAQRKIPSSLLRAQCRMAELTLLAETGQETIGRRQRKEIKEDISQQLLPQMPPQLSGVPFVIDAAAKRLYLGAASDKQLEAFSAFFHQTIGFEPIPLTPEVLVVDQLESAPEEFSALNFSPDQPDSMAAGTLGQNFLTWLWFYLEEHEGKLPRTQLGEFSMVVDGPLVLVAEGPGALESAIRKGMPTISAEAKAALTVGKKLRQAKLIMARGNERWETTVDADSFVFRGMKLPEGEALDPGSIFQERINNIYVFETLFLQLFKYYLNQISDRANIQQIQAQAQNWVREMHGK